MNETMRLVAVGDSVSEGVGDPCRGGFRGWVHYLADEAGFELVANLARAGSRVADVRDRQLDRAAAAAPDIVTCVVGVNDVLWPTFDAAAFAVDFDHVIGVLTMAAKRGVLMMTLHDVAADLPLHARARTRLRERTAQVNEVIGEVALCHGAWVLDARTVPALRPAGMISLDMLHPNRRGHRFIALSALAVLRAQGVVPPGPPASPPEADPLQARVAAGIRHLAWVIRHILAGLPARARRVGR